MTRGRTVRTGSSDWGTPLKVVRAVHAAFGGPPGLDPCSGPESVVGALRCYAPPQDGLVLPWDASTVYVNPPYGRDRVRGTALRHWVARCRAAADDGAEVIALVPVATSTSHWKEHVFGVAARVCFLADSRVRFRIDGNEDNKGGPMPVAAVYWGGRPEAFGVAFGPLGAVVAVRG